MSSLLSHLNVASNAIMIGCLFFDLRFDYAQPLNEYRRLKQYYYYMGLRDSRLPYRFDVFMAAIVSTITTITRLIQTPNVNIVLSLITLLGACAIETKFVIPSWLRAVKNGPTENIPKFDAFIQKAGYGHIMVLIGLIASIVFSLP